MWNFPNQLVLFPTDSGELFRKVAHRLLGESTKRCKAHLLTAAAPEDLSPEFLRWMIESTDKNSASMKLACNQPKVIRSMFGAVPEQQNQALVELFQTLTHISRDSLQAGSRFRGLTQWVDPLRKFSVCFSGRGEALVGQATVDLFDDDISTDSPFLRIHSRREHPEGLSAPIDVARRVSYHKYWRFGHQNIVLSNPADWAGSDAPIDSIGALAESELVALQDGIALLAKHIPHWSARAADLVSYYHYTPDVLPDELYPRVCYIQAHKNPIIVAERILQAEVDAQLRSSSLVMSWVKEPLSLEDLFNSPSRSTSLDSLIGLASCSRISTFHASLHAHGHPSVGLSSMHERREQFMDELGERYESFQLSDSLGPLGRHLLEEVETCRSWAKRVAPAARPRLNIARPKRILMINLDFQDAVYSYLFQRTFCLLANQRRHDVDVIRPHPTRAGTDIPCELGLEEEYLSLGEGEDILLESDDLRAAHLAISRLIKANDYDAIVANIRVDTLYYLLEESPKDLSGIPIITYDRHLHHRLDTYGVTPERIENLQRHTIYVNGLIEIARGGADTYKRRTAGFDMSRVHQWPWAVDESFFNHARSQRKGRCRVPFEPSGRMTLFSGGNSKRDYETLFEAVAELPVNVRIATSLSFEEVPSNVSILGRVFLHEFRNEVRNCDAVVLPLGSRDEDGIGAVGITVVALAFALEKPVLCTQTDFLTEYIVDGESGLLVPPFNPRAMKTAIRSLLDDETYRNKLAKNGKHNAFSTEDLAQVMLNQLDCMPETVEKYRGENCASINEPLSIAILHMNSRQSWDLHRLIEVRDIIRSEYELSCELIDMRDPYAAEDANPAGSDELPDIEVRRELLARLQDLRTNYVVADKCPTAYAYLKTCQELGQELAPTVLITDYHMLGRIELIQENFNKGGARNMLGKWWPANNIQLLSCYPSFWGLYERAGLTFHDLRWLPLASQKQLEPGPRPSECSYAVAGGVHMRDLELIRKVLTNLPERYRRRIIYFGTKPDIDWEKTGIRYEGRLPFVEFYKTLCNARFMISPAKVGASSFGGVSTADITRSAGRPLLTHDTPPLRDALGANNTIFCPAGDEKSLTEDIIRCFDDDAFVDQIYAECEQFCEANSTRNYAKYLVAVAGGWQAPLSS
jgi:glycosyltransferase involved in cell wall biosynthesis